MPAKKDPAVAIITQVKNLTVKSTEELTQVNQAEVIKVTPPTPAPAAIMSVPAPVQDNPDPIAMDTTVHTITMKELIERLIAIDMMGNTTSLGIPDLIYQVSCDNEAHKVTSDMTKGFFSISGKEFIRKSCAQVNDIYEMGIKTKGCGYEGCESTLEDALWPFSGLSSATSAEALTKPWT